MYAARPVAVSTTRSHSEGSGDGYDRIALIQDRDVEALVAALRKLPRLAVAVADDRNRLSSVPYCILAGIYSLGRKSIIWQNMVNRYARYYNLPPARSTTVTRGTVEPTVSEFISQIEGMGAQRFAADVLRDMSPTSSSVHAILRSDAAVRYAWVLKAHRIERLADVLAYPNLDMLEYALRQIPGQGPGKSTHWFFICAGIKDRIKLDRHLEDFLSRLRLWPTPQQANELFRAACKQLEPEFPGITPSALDLVIWKSEAAGQKHRSLA